MISWNEDGPGQVSIRFSGPTIEESRQVFSEHLDRALDGPYSVASLDLSDVTAIQSTWLGRILLYYKKFTEKGKVLRIKKCSRELYEILLLIKLETIIPIEM